MLKGELTKPGRASVSKANACPEPRRRARGALGGVPPAPPLYGSGADRDGCEAGSALPVESLS